MRRKLIKWMLVKTEDSMMYFRLIIMSFSLMVFSGCKTYYSRFYADPEANYEAALINPVDVIIVPGYPHKQEGWSELTKMRVCWAVHLYEREITKNIIFSGSAVYSPYIESKIMAMYAEELGVPKEHILTESCAEHSTENLYYSYKLAKEQGFKSVGLATDVIQLSFLKSVSHKLGVDSIRYIPIVYDTLRAMNRSEPIIDQNQAFVPHFVPITERENIFKRIKGTRGGKVKRILRKDKRSNKRNK